MYVTLLAPRKPERGSRSGPPLLTWEKTDMRRFATLRNAACALAGAAMLTLAGCGSEAPPPPPPPAAGIVTIRAPPVTNYIPPPVPVPAVPPHRGRARASASATARPPAHRARERDVGREGGCVGCRGAWRAYLK